MKDNFFVDGVTELLRPFASRDKILRKRNKKHKTILSEIKTIEENK